MSQLARTLEDSRFDDFEDVGAFGRDGIARALSSEPFGWTHVRWNGVPLYPQRYMRADDFVEGAAAVQRFSDKASAFHIDLAGTPLYRRRFHSVGRFRSGLATACDDTGAFHITKDGAPLYADRYASVCEFAQGFAYVRCQDGSTGLVDAQGVFIPHS